MENANLTPIMILLMRSTIRTLKWQLSIWKGKKGCPAKQYIYSIKKQRKAPSCYLHIILNDWYKVLHTSEMVHAIIIDCLAEAWPPIAIIFPLILSCKMKAMSGVRTEDHQTPWFAASVPPLEGRLPIEPAFLDLTRCWLLAKCHYEWAPGQCCALNQK